MIKKITLLILFLLIIACGAETIKKDSEFEPIIVKEPEPITEPKVEKVFVKTLKEAPAGYPKKISQISEDEYGKVKAKLELFVSKQCKPVKWDGGGMEQTKAFSVRLDHFGYLESLSCYNLPEGDVSGTSVEKVAKDHLKNYERYLGIENVNLEFLDYRNVGQNFFISTKPQMYKEILVFDGSTGSAQPAIINLVMTKTDMLTGLNGHYYANIEVPVKPVITLDQVNDNLFGEDISFANEEGKKVEKKVNKNDLKYTGNLIILAHTNKNLEYRLVWQIPISFGWTSYVDAITGEVLSITQDFLT